MCMKNTYYLTPEPKVSPRRKLLRLLSLTLVLLIVTLSVAAKAPTLSRSGEISLIASGGEPYPFTRDDFAPVIRTDLTLRGVLVVSLPESGVLQLGGRVLLSGEAVAVESLDALWYIPGEEDRAQVQFTLLPIYAETRNLSPFPVTLVMGSAENLPPIAQNVEVRTYKDIAVTGNFDAQDPEGGAVTYKITAKPKRGSVGCGTDGTFIYTPYPGKIGKDTFKYAAVDTSGNLSEEATVKLKIEKPETKVTYADMTGNTAHYAAMRLLEEGIFEGEVVGQTGMFRPETPLTRAEMLTLVVQVARVSPPPAVSQTGYYDDAEIPDWFKPTAAVALREGIFSGEITPNGTTVMHADAPATVAETVTALNNALREVALTDDTLPVWAGDDVNPLGVFAEDDTTVLTRGEAAVLMSKAMDVNQKKTHKFGLLSWVY